MSKRSYLAYLWILACLFCFASSKIVIQDIIGPSWVEFQPHTADSTEIRAHSSELQVNNSSEVEVNNLTGLEANKSAEFVLDCDYVASSEEQDVVVKWFYNGLEEQIYQWITDYNIPRNPSVVGPRFRNHIDTNYSVLVNGKKSYRALKLVNIDPTLSGNYTCKVSSTYSEHVMTKQVIIYSPASPLQIYYMEADEIIICDAANVAPKPLFEVIIVGRNSTTVEMPPEFEYKLTEKSDDKIYYNMSITLSYNSSLLPEDSAFFMCRIKIPGTDYIEEEYGAQLDRNIVADLDSLLSNLEGDLNFISEALNSTYEDIATLEVNSGNHRWASLNLLIFLIFSIFSVK